MLYLLSVHSPHQNQSLLHHGSKDSMITAPSATNVTVELDVSTGGENFEIKKGLITMVHASSFCAKANENFSAHLHQSL